MPDSDSLLTNIYQILDDKKAVKEIENLRHCISDYNSWNRLGNVLLDKGYYDLAGECYRQVLKYNPTSTYALYNIGLALFNLNKYKESIEYYKKVIDLDPDNADAFGAIAISLQHQNKHDEANEYYEKSKKLREEKINSIFKKAEDCRLTGQFDLSIKLYDQILNLEPTHIESLYNKGLCHLELREYNEALICFRKVIELDNNYADAWYNKGLCHLELREYNEALICFQKVIELDNNYADAWYNKANIEFKKNNIENAIGFYDKAISLYKKEDNRIKEIRTLKKIRNIYANHTFNFINSSIKSGELMALDNNDPIIQCMFAEDLILTSNYQKSRKFINDALKTIPDEKVTSKTLLKFYSLCSSLLDNSLLSNSDHYINEFLEFYQKLDEDFKIKQEIWNFNGIERYIMSSQTSDANKKFLQDVISMLRGSTKEKSKVLAKFASNLSKSKIEVKKKYKTAISIAIVATILIVSYNYYTTQPSPKPISNIFVNQTIGDIQIDPEKSKLYYTVPNIGKFFTVDWNDERTLKAWPLPNGSDNIKLDPRYDRIYISNYNSSNLTIINKIYDNDLQIDQLTVRPGTVDIELSANATIAFIANFENKSIDVYDLNNRNKPLIDTISLINIPFSPQLSQIYQQSLSFDSEEDRLYAIEDNGHNITIIDLKDKKKSKIELGNKKIANGLVFNSKYDKVYALDYSASKVYAIDVKKDNIKDISVGKFPLNIILDKNEELLYIANEKSKSISIINCSTDIITKTLDLSKSPFKIAYDDKNNYIYVQYKEDFSIGRISLNEIDIPSKIFTGNDPGILYINDKKNEIYVIDKSDLLIINGNNNTIKKVIHVGSLDSKLNDVVYDHKNDILFIVNINGQSLGNLLIYNASYPYNMIDNVTVGIEPTSVAVSDKSGKIYVSHYSHNNVYVLVKDGDKYSIQDNISLGDVYGATDIAVNSNNNTDIIYVTNSLSDTITIIKEKPYSLSDKKDYDLIYKTVGKGPSELFFDSKNNKLYVVNRVSDSVSILSSETDTIEKTILTGESPTTITQNKNLLFVTNSASNTISVLDPSIDVIYPIKTIESLGEKPTGIVYNPNNNNLYISNLDSNYISIINVSLIDSKYNTTENKYIVKNIQVDKGPIYLKFNKDDNLIYVVNRFSDIVSKINSTTDNIIIDTKDIKTEILSNSIDFNRRNGEIYILNDVTDNITTFHKNGTLLDTIDAGSDPSSMTVDVDNHDLYITNTNLKNITRIDEKNHKNIKEIHTEFVPTQVISTPILLSQDNCPSSPSLLSSPSLFFVLFNNQEEEIIKVYGGGIENESSVLLYKKIGKGHSSFAFDGKNKIYLTNELSGILKIIDLCNLANEQTFHVDSPTDVTINPNTNTIFLANQMSDVVYAIDGKTNKMIEIPVMPSPTSMDIDLKLNKVYVTSYKTNTISVISNK